MQPTRVVLIEDNDLTRVGMRISLQQQGIEVVAEAATGREGLHYTTTLRPEIVVVDLALPDLDGIEVTRRIKADSLTGGIAATAPKVLILTFQDQPQAVLAAFAAGADSYCMKDVSPQRLREAIQATQEGHHWIDPAIAGIILQQSRQSNLRNSTLSSSTPISQNPDPNPAKAPSRSPLTERELEVLKLIVEGDSNALIAERLYISIGTVKTHVRSILNKLCADDRTQAAVRALRSGLLH
jgi:two-component system, NarL family, response regulator LiaR